MTVTADQTARTNREGDPCPSWCITDHAKYSFHASEQVPEPYHWIIRAVRYPTERRAHLQVSTMDVALDDAGALAAIIEELADAAPADVRELAAAIRQAAAAITEAGRA